MGNEYILGTLKYLKEDANFNKHHPEIILKGDVISYYYDYWVLPNSFVILTVEPMTSILDTKYCLRIIKPSEISSITLDAYFNDKDLSGVKATPVATDALWQSLVNGIITSAKTGDKNAGLEYKNVFLDLGMWTIAKKYNTVNNNLADILTTVFDPGGIGHKSARHIANLSSISQMSVYIEDWYKLGTIKTLVESDESLKNAVNTCFTSCGMKRFTQWKTPEEIAHTPIISSYKYGDRVRFSGKYYISSVDNNNSTPGKSSTWIEYTEE